MSTGIFNDLRSFDMPDSTFNQGPLPTGSGIVPSAVQINYASTLLGDVQPYAYGKPAHIADQTAVLNTPHKIGKIVPQLLLPDPRHSVFSLSHGVDDGDIAFVVRMDRSAGTIEQQHTFERLELGRIVDPFVNLATCNYLLAGVQRAWNDPAHVHWQQFMVDTGFAPPLSDELRAFSVKDALRFVSDIIRPFGICHGSAMQGGQHEGSTSSVSWPVNYSTAMAVSGRVENLANLWRDSHISAGDDLIMRLEWLPILGVEYVLNHWEQGLVRHRFENGPSSHGWQLVPAVWDLNPPDLIIENYDWRENGYWHICRSQVMKSSEVSYKSTSSVRQKCYLDDSRLMRGSLLEVNFEPIWVQHRRLRPLEFLHAANAHHHNAPVPGGPAPPAPGGPAPPAAPPPVPPSMLRAPIVLLGAEMSADAETLAAQKPKKARKVIP